MTRPDAHFDDENDAVEYIRLRLAETLPEHLAGAVAGQFEVYCGLDTPLNEWPGSESLDTTSDGPFEVDIGAPFLGPWTVREQDLGDVGTIAALVAGFSLSEPGRRLDPFVQLTMAAVCMLWRLKRRGVSISPLQRDVLIAIRRRGAVSSETLASDARAMSAPEFIAARLVRVGFGSVGADGPGHLGGKVFWR